MQTIIPIPVDTSAGPREAAVFILIAWPFILAFLMMMSARRWVEITGTVILCLALIGVFLVLPLLLLLGVIT